MSVPQRLPPDPPEDVRAGRPYLFRRTPLQGFLRRTVRVLALAVVDITGLTIGLYLALALRALVRDPKPVLWNLLWNAESDWLPFLVLLMLLVFWRNRLYGPRELREGVGRVMASVALVAALTLAFAIGTSQHITTFGLYVVGALSVAVMISLLRWAYETVTGGLLRAAGVRRRVLFVGNGPEVDHLRSSLGASRSGILYEFLGRVQPGPELTRQLREDDLDELIVADDGLREEVLLEIVDTAHREGVRVRIA